MYWKTNSRKSVKLATGSSPSCLGKRGGKEDTRRNVVWPLPPPPHPPPGGEPKGRSVCPPAITSHRNDSWPLTWRSLTHRDGARSHTHLLLPVSSHRSKQAGTRRLSLYDFFEPTGNQRIVCCQLARPSRLGYGKVGHVYRQVSFA